MVCLVHDKVRGRSRFRINGRLRTERFKEEINASLSRDQSIRAFDINLLTGSVLVFYNSGSTSQSVRAVIEDTARTVLGMPLSDCNGVEKDSVSKAVAPAAASSGRKMAVGSRTRRQIRRSVLRAEDQHSEAWHRIDAEAVMRSLEVAPNSGLEGTTAKERIRRFGPNLLPESVPRSGLSIFADQFKSLPVALLGVAAAVSIATGGIADALVIGGVVLINGLIGYTTETQAEKTIHSLKSLVRPSALCLRDGRLATLPSEDIVPGDILVLRPGSYVSADARLIEAVHLSIDESALTGESMPVSKDPMPLDEVDMPLADRINMVYMGTLVTGGQGLAVVIATGRYTEIGKIQTLVGDSRPPETPMERQLDRIGTQLVYISGAVCSLVFVIGLLRGYGLLHMLKSSIALAVAAVPEGLPMVATTTLALGIRSMRKHNVLIRHLDAVETLGSVQTICLDKTGTITVNRMTVTAIHSGMKRIGVKEGRFRDNDRDLNPYECDELLRLIHISCLCNESEVSLQEGEYTVRGSATENALINMAVSAGINVPQLRQKFPLIKIRHRSENCNIMVTLHDAGPTLQNGPNSRLIAVKGSPQEVLALCSSYIRDGVLGPMSDEDRVAIQIENEQMAGEALRMLGVAYMFCEASNDIPDGPELCGVNAGSIDLVWLGLTGMIDPVRNGVKELIAGYHASGIDTIMITGDQGPTAYAIGRDLNLSRNGQIEILDSTHLANIDPELLSALTRKVHVFSRVSPANKLQIVQALQASGKIVAMTGDGINDGPALKAANIGIAMGHTGTDVAREVADVIIEDDRLETMIIAISQGRTIYNNIRKSVHFLLSTNLSEIMVMFGSLGLGLGEPLNAMQLLWINLVSDIAPGLALALEAPEPDILSRPPRNPDDPIIRKEDFRRIAFESAALSGGALAAYGYGIARYGIGPQAGTMAFMGLTAGQLLHALSCRSEQFSMFSSEKLPPNRYLDAALAASFLLQGITMAVPGIRNLLGLASIGLLDWMVVAGTAAAPLLINEATKTMAPLPVSGNGPDNLTCEETPEQIIEEAAA